MPRAFLIVMDSVGIGGAPDADQFFNGTRPDTGSNTLAHIAQACAAGLAEEGRSGPLSLDCLNSLGLGAALELASDETAPNLNPVHTGLYAAATEVSNGKDTPSGHWEIAGVPVPWDWHHFPNSDSAFPDDVITEVCLAAGTGGLLGNRHASGTVIIEEEGARHIETGWPIVYTSADSVLQIAAHEEHFGLERLLKLCQDVAPLLHSMKVGRVIARPFIGSAEDGFTRTANRHDYAIETPSPTLCNWVSDAGGHVYAIGKIGDIFSMSGIDEVRKGPDDQLITHLDDLISEAKDNSFTFANFVEFDAKYGHRRDVSGYARHLEWFNVELSRLLPKFRPDDLVILTADHGNDPTWSGTDHTRERVPVLVHLPSCAKSGSLGHIAFADIAATIAAHLNVAAQGPGRTFL